MADIFNYYHEIDAPDGVVFMVWTRYSFDDECTPHNDLSIECKNVDEKETKYGLMYHGHLEHPTDEPEADDRMCAIEALVRTGNPL